MTTTAEQLVARAREHVRGLTPAQVEAHLLTRASVLVDVREPEELEEHGWIAGAVHVPRGLLEFWADPTSPRFRAELDPGRHTIVYCAAGDRSVLAAETLAALGYTDVSQLDGGIAAWKQADLPVVGLESWHRDVDTRPSADTDRVPHVAR